MDKKDTRKGETAIANFKEQYNKAVETYKLPALSEMAREFDLLDTVGREGHCPTNILAYTRWCILRLVNNWASYLNEYIVPNQQNITSMECASHLDDNDRNNVEKFMAWAMYKTKCANLIQLDKDNPAKNAEIIKQIFHEWQEQKGIISKVIKKDADAWKASLNK